jgi:hypothetical protein
VPLLLAPLVGFVIGVALAWAAGPELGRDDGPLVASRPFAIAAAFALLVYTPIVGYFVAFHGDWSYAYAIASRRIPSAVDLGLVLASGGTVVLGLAVAVPQVRKRRMGALITLLVAPSTVALAALALVARRLAVNATYAQFHRDFGGEPIAESALGRGVLVMGILLALGIAWCVRAIGQMMNTEAHAPQAPAAPRR